MTQDKIPDFTETELWTVRQALKERYGKDVEVQLADSDIRLHPEARGLTLCPCLIWTERNAHFVIFKAGERAYRCQFFYRGYEQFGTGKPEYDDLGQCVITLLQVQADHERKLAENPPTAPAVNPSADSDFDSNAAPNFWGD
jgi:hypothetical protein